MHQYQNQYHTHGPLLVTRRTEVALSPAHTQIVHWSLLLLVVTVVTAAVAAQTNADCYNCNTMTVHVPCVFVC